MTSVRAVRCIWVEGFDEEDFLAHGLDLTIEILERSGYGPEFVVWNQPEDRERSLSFKRAKLTLKGLFSANQSFHIFSVGVEGRRDFHKPFSYFMVDRSDCINRLLLYCPAEVLDPLLALEAIFRGRLCNAYIYTDDVLDAPPSYFFGVDYVGPLGEASKPPFKKSDRIEHWRNNLWKGLDPCMGFVSEIHEINIWSQATLDFPLGKGTVQSYLDENPIGRVGSSCGKFLLELDPAEQETLRRVFDAAGICLAGFDATLAAARN
jgi:hypothetical protein